MVIKWAIFGIRGFLMGLTRNDFGFFLLEEPSANEMLKGILPRILPENIHVRYVVFDGK